jgi:hypothetical protein
MPDPYQTALARIRAAAENLSRTAINRLLSPCKPLRHAQRNACGLTDASRIYPTSMP